MSPRVEGINLHVEIERNELFEKRGLLRRQVRNKLTSTMENIFLLVTFGQSPSHAKIVMTGGHKSEKKKANKQGHTGLHNNRVLLAGIKGRSGMPGQRRRQ